MFQIHLFFVEYLHVLLLGDVGGLRMLVLEMAIVLVDIVVREALILARPAAMTVLEIMFAQLPPQLPGQYVKMGRVRLMGLRHPQQTDHIFVVVVVGYGFLLEEPRLRLLHLLQELLLQLLVLLLLQVVHVEPTPGQAPPGTTTDPAAGAGSAGPFPGR